MYVFILLFAQNNTKTVFLGQEFGDWGGGNGKAQATSCFGNIHYLEGGETPIHWINIAQLSSSDPLVDLILCQGNQIWMTM